MPEMNKESIIRSLKTVEDPDLKKDLVTLNMVKEIKIDKENIHVIIELTTPACPLKDKIKQDCINAIKHEIPEAEDVHIEMTSKVTHQQNEEKEAILPGVKNKPFGRHSWDLCPVIC